MKWSIQAAAQTELEEATAWYEAVREGLGVEFLDEFEAGIRRIGEFPHAWQALSHRTRQHQLNRFPYAIVYQVENDVVVIVAVAHLHRRPTYWQNRISD